jgi:hypothetical protein
LKPCQRIYGRCVCSLNCSMFTEYSLNVHWMFTECSLNVHWLFTDIKMNDHINNVIYIEWILEALTYMEWTFTESLKPWLHRVNIHWMFTESSLNVHWMFTEYSLNVHGHQHERPHQ